MQPFELLNLGYDITEYIHVIGGFDTVSRSYWYLEIFERKEFKY